MFVGLLLLICGGMHTVWAIYQLVFYKTSEIYRSDLEHINKTEWREKYVAVVMFSEQNVLMLTVMMWYVGVLLGSYVAGWFLVRVVQKRNIYVSFVIFMDFNHLSKISTFFSPLTLINNFSNIFSMLQS